MFDRAIRSMAKAWAAGHRQEITAAVDSLKRQGIVDQVVRAVEKEEDLMPMVPAEAFQKARENSRMVKAVADVDFVIEMVEKTVPEYAPLVRAHKSYVKEQLSEFRRRVV